MKKKTNKQITVDNRQFASGFKNLKYALENPKKIRVFESGASRNNADNKLEYHKFNSPLVEWGFAQYMHKHRFLEDGTMREGDNWQKGFDNDTILASLRRHIMDLELLEKGLKVTENGKEVSLLDTLYAIRFNANARILKELEGLKGVERNYIE